MESESRIRRIARRAGSLLRSEQPGAKIYDYTEDGKLVPVPPGETIREPELPLKDNHGYVPDHNEHTTETSRVTNIPVRTIDFDVNPISLASQELHIPSHKIQELPPTVIAEHVIFDGIDKPQPLGEIATLTGDFTPGIGVQIQDYVGVRKVDDNSEPQVVASRTITAYIPLGDGDLGYRMQEVGTTGHMPYHLHPVFTSSPVAQTSARAL